jgi:hypothetical protein
VQVLEALFVVAVSGACAGAFASAADAMATGTGGDAASACVGTNAATRMIMVAGTLNLLRTFPPQELVFSTSDRT